RRRARADAPSQVAQDALDLLALFDLELPQLVPELHHRRRLHEDGRAARRLVVDEAAELAAVFRLHGDAVAVVPDRDDRVLDHVAVGGVAEIAVQPLHHAAVGELHLLAHARQLSRTAWTPPSGMPPPVSSRRCASEFSRSARRTAASSVSGSNAAMTPFPSSHAAYPASIVLISSYSSTRSECAFMVSGPRP